MAAIAPGAARVEDIAQRIRAEYLEMPGLRLTPVQAQRLWGLDRVACDAILGALVEANFLTRTRDGAFVRADGGPSMRRAGRMANSAA